MLLPSTTGDRTVATSRSGHSPLSIRDRLSRACGVIIDCVMGVLTVMMLLVFGNGLGYLPLTSVVLLAVGIVTAVAVATAGVLALMVRELDRRADQRAASSIAGGAAAGSSRQRRDPQLAELSS